MYNVRAVGGDSLYQLKDGRCQLIHGGAVTTIMHGGSRMLVAKELIALLEQIGSPAFRVVKSATIWRRREDREYNTHVEATGMDQLHYGQLRNHDLLGEQLFSFEGYLLVTPSLKKRLQQAGFDSLRFDLGFPRLL